MKKLLLVGLSSLMLSTLAITAQTNPANANSTRRLSPFQLVTRAYRGQIEGIAGPVQFVRADYQPRELIQLAVDAGDLPPETLEDTRYINVVRFHLRGFRPQRGND